MNNSFPSIESGTGGKETTEALGTVESAFGGVPNLMKKIASAPGVLKGVMEMNNGVTKGSITPALVEQIALLTSSMNSCEYCVAVHVQVGQQCGIERSELISNMRGNSDDKRTQAVLDFTQEVVNRRGQISQDTVARLRKEGYDNRQIIEMLGVIGLYTFLNYAKHLTQPGLDFPEVQEFSGAATAA